jgi:hypothetical protein
MERGLSPFRHHYGGEGALGQNGTGILINFFRERGRGKEGLGISQERGFGTLPDKRNRTAADRRGSAVLWDRLSCPYACKFLISRFGQVEILTGKRIEGRPSPRFLSGFLSEKGRVILPLCNYLV